MTHVHREDCDMDEDCNCGVAELGDAEAENLRLRLALRRLLDALGNRLPRATLAQRRREAEALLSTPPR